MRFTMTAMLALLLAFLPTPAAAQDDEGFILRIDGDVRISRGEVVGGVLVIDGNVFVEGTVTDAVVVIDGTAIISGVVEGDITVIEGDLELRDGSTVKDVTLIRSDLQRSSGATVTGDIEERENFVLFRGAWVLFSVLLWLSFSVAVIVAGLLFAAVGGRQLKAASLALTEEVGNSILAAVIVWIAAPVAAVMLIITVIGIPLGIGLMLFVLPAIWLLGYLAAGTRLGMLVTGYLRREPGGHPYAAAFVGLLLLQILAIVPVVGFIVAGIAGLWGAGGIALVAFRAVRGRPAAPVSPEAASPVA